MTEALKSSASLVITSLIQIPGIKTLPQRTHASVRREERAWEW